MNVRQQLSGEPGEAIGTAMANYSAARLCIHVARKSFQVDSLKWWIEIRLPFGSIRLRRMRINSQVFLTYEGRESRLRKKIHGYIIHVIHKLVRVRFHKSARKWPRFFSTFPEKCTWKRVLGSMREISLTTIHLSGNRGSRESCDTLIQSSSRFLQMIMDFIFASICALRGVRFGRTRVRSVVSCMNLYSVGNLSSSLYVSYPK